MVGLLVVLAGIAGCGGFACFLWRVYVKARREHPGAQFTWEAKVLFTVAIAAALLFAGILIWNLVRGRT